MRPVEPPEKDGASFLGAAAANVKSRGVSAAKPMVYRFPAHLARPLPAPAGSVVAWMGNLVHWGASCAPHADVDQPRISMALTLRLREFRGIDAEHVESTTGRAPMPRSHLRGMELKNRLSVVGKSLIMYSHWMNGYSGLDLDLLKRGVVSPPIH